MKVLSIFFVFILISALQAYFNLTRTVTVILRFYFSCKSGKKLQIQFIDCGVLKRIDIHSGERDQSRMVKPVLVRNEAELNFYVGAASENRKQKLIAYIVKRF